jgi:hypothetical protein
VYRLTLFDVLVGSFVLQVTCVRGCLIDDFAGRHDMLLSLRDSSCQNDSADITDSCLS